MLFWYQYNALQGKLQNAQEQIRIDMANQFVFYQNAVDIYLRKFVQGLPMSFNGSSHSFKAESLKLLVDLWFCVLSYPHLDHCYGGSEVVWTPNLFDGPSLVCFFFYLGFGNGPHDQTLWFKLYDSIMIQMKIRFVFGHSAHYTLWNIA